MPDPGVRESSSTRAVREEVAKRLSKNVQVQGLSYIGKDTKGRPMYRVVYTTKAGPGFRPAAFGRGSTPSAPRVVRTFAWAKDSNGVFQMQEPFTQPQAFNRTSDDAQLRIAKDRWLNRLTALDDSQISDNERVAFTKMVNNWNGPVDQLNRSLDIALRNLPFGSTGVIGEQDDDAGLLDGFSFGGGGGGGFSGPEYRAPDRRVVEDMTKGMMTSLIGDVDETRLDAFVNLYMKDHRRNFDSASAEIDPAQSVMEAIRNTDAYKQIHALRPDSEDERSWISNRANLAKRGGLNTEDVEQFAITQASVGGDEVDIQDAAAAHQFANTGSVKGTTMDQKMRNTVTNMFRSVVV